MRSNLVEHFLDLIWKGIRGAREWRFPPGVVSLAELELRHHVSASSNDSHPAVAKRRILNFSVSVVGRLRHRLMLIRKVQRGCLASNVMVVGAAAMFKAPLRFLLSPARETCHCFYK